MALMTAMREKMHVVLWILLAMFLLSMTIGGLVGGANIIDQLFGNVNPSTTIAQINDENIPPGRFNSLVNQQLENIRSKNQNINDAQIGQARDNAWDNLLQDVLVSQEVNRLNITASNEEVLYYLENNPPPFLQQNPNFQTDGKFDLEKFKLALSNPQGDEWTPIENFMKNTYIPNYKLQKMLDESIIITEEEIKNEFIKNNVNYTIDGIHITNDKISSKDSEPNENEMNAEYVAKKDEFKHDELRNIRSVSWPKIPSKQDSIITENLAKEIYKKAKSGADFKNLANTYSKDPGNLNGTKGGDLGWFKKGRMVKAFDEAAFAANKGDVVAPIKSQFGTHIIFVRDIRNDKNENKEILASHILLKVEVSPTTLDDLKREAILFSYDAQDNGFDTALDSYNKTPDTHEKIEESSFSINILGPLRSAIRFAFDSKLNAVSDLLENDRYFAVFTLDKIISPGIKSYEEVKSQINNKLKREKTKKLTLEKSNNLLIKISSLESSLENIQKNDPSITSIENEIQTLSRGFKSIGKSNYVTGAILKAKKGDLIGPLETRSGYTIIEINEIGKFDSTLYSNQRESIYLTIFGQKQNQLFTKWLDHLKKNSDIVDNRKFYF